jgi:hypothetical protein
MKLIIIMSLAVSCASNLKSYRKVTNYTEIGVKCAQDYYYSLRYNKCIYMPGAIVSRTLTSTYKASPDTVISLSKPIKRKAKVVSKVDCKVILDNINKRSL